MFVLFQTIRAVQGSKLSSRSDDSYSTFSCKLNQSYRHVEGVWNVSRKKATYESVCFAWNAPRQEVWRIFCFCS